MVSVTSRALLVLGSASSSDFMWPVMTGHGPAQRVKMMSATQTRLVKSASVVTLPSWLVSVNPATAPMTGSGACWRLNSASESRYARPRKPRSNPKPSQSVRGNCEDGSPMPPEIYLQITPAASQARQARRRCVLIGRETRAGAISNHEFADKHGWN